MTDYGVSSVDSYTSLLHELLNKGRQIKPAALIDPALRVEDLKQEIDDLATCSKRVGNKNYAAIETAVRNIFYTFLVIFSNNSQIEAKCSSLGFQLNRRLGLRANMEPARHCYHPFGSR